jgi:hypothetical protein
VVTPPDGRPPADAAGEARLGPREQARLDEAVVTVARRGRGPAIAVALIVGAFLVGVVRPWDWLTGDAGFAPGGDARQGGAPGSTGAAGVPGSSFGAGVPVPGSSPGATGSEAPAAAYQAPTCAYPISWRTASLQLWAGRDARVWTAAEAVSALGPADPSIPFHPIASDTVEAIGWCAPVSGADRPPATAAAVLYRLGNGTATEVPVHRLEPAAASALGELWAPMPVAGDRPPRWPDGRYVIRLATPSGDYVRYLGLDVGVVQRVATPSPGASPSAGAGGSPGATAEVPAGVSPSAAGGSPGPEVPTTQP